MGPRHNRHSQIWRSGARYGGRARIPWPEWDRAVEEWKAERRAEFDRKKLLGRVQSAALQQTLS